MKPETVSLLCVPETHEPLTLARDPVPGGHHADVLVGVQTGRRFDIKEGIPILLDETPISGLNLRYQGFYNRIAGLYDPAIRLFATVVGRKEGDFRKQYLSELGVPEKGRFLEVSIGTGANIQHLPQSVECYGLDLSWGMLTQCRRNLQRWQREAELILGNAEALPLLNDVFDSVLHVGGINAFNDREKAIREMIRVARPGSKIMIVDETAKLLKSIAWFPGIRKMLVEYGDRFSAPSALVPPEMLDVHVLPIANGHMYCLTFRKP